MGSETIGHVAIVSKGVIAFIGVAAVLVIVANTPAYPIALGVVIIALLFVMLDSGFPALLQSATSFVSGSVGQKGA